MQLTEVQIERSLAALRGDPVPAPSATERDDGPAVPDGLADALAGSPDVRPDRLAEARRRLARGEGPSDADLADRMIGRIVCDRLR